MIHDLCRMFRAGYGTPDRVVFLVWRGRHAGHLLRYPVLRIAGDVDGYTAPELRQQLIEFVDKGARHIVADLREVDFLDSTGLGALVGGLKRMRLRQGSLELVVSGGRVMQLFDVTGLSRAFALHKSILNAIAADLHWQAALAGGDSGTGNHRAEEWCRAHELS